MICRLAVVAFLLIGQIGIAQAPAGAPSGTTGLCNDGTYFTGATKSGACRGHKGLKTWFAASATPAAKASAKTTPSQPATPAPAPKPVAAAPPPVQAAPPASTPKTTATTPKTPFSQKATAPGGGPGLVWLNTASNVYHCSGSQYYGKTKAGAYMSETDAKAKGAHPDGGKPCK